MGNIIKIIKCARLNEHLRVTLGITSVLEIVVKYDANSGEPKGIQCDEYNDDAGGECRFKYSGVEGSTERNYEKCTFNEWKEIK